MLSLLETKLWEEEDLPNAPIKNLEDSSIEKSNLRHFVIDAHFPNHFTSKTSGICGIVSHKVTENVIGKTAKRESYLLSLSP